jgi:hypothetical protein
VSRALLIGPTVRPPLVSSVARDIGVPVAIRLAEMLFQLLFVAILDRGTSYSLASRFTIWDGQLYADIAQYGYPSRIVIADHQLVQGKEFAFFPVYPALIAATHTVTRLDFQAAEVLVAIVAGCVLSELVHLLVLARNGSRSQGYLAAALIGALPMAVVLQMGYAEALLAALSAGAYLAALRGRWCLAGALLFAAGLTRPVGYVAALAIPLLARRSAAVPLLARRAAAGLTLRQQRPILFATLAGLASSPIFWIFVAIRTHRLTGWFDVEQAGWGTHLDGGRETASFIWTTVSGQAAEPVVASCVVISLAFYLSVIAVIARRKDPAWFVLGVLALASVVLSTNYWHSKPRLLLAGVLLVIPLAQRMSARIKVLIPVVVIMLALSSWFGAYMITQWPYAI